MYLNIKEINEMLPIVRGVFFVPFVVNHAFEIEGGEFDGLSAQKMIGIQSMLETQAKFGFAYTCFLDGKPVAVFGCSILWEGVGEMWSVIGDIARTKPVAMTKVGIAFVDICQISLGLHRLQITVKTSNNSAVKWARAIGFISECVMKRYSADKLDYNLMVRLVDDND
jgi:RimJ/RimL family protein N-acetyltransferase